MVSMEKVLSLKWNPRLHSAPDIENYSTIYLTSVISSIYINQG